MRVIEYASYGPPEVLHFADLPKPTPKDNEILVKVRATTVTIGDVRMRSFTVPIAQWIFARLYLGILKPRRKVLGMELSGEVEAVGAKVTRYKKGDAILGSTFATGFGGYAEYKCFPEDSILTIKPNNLSYEEAAAVAGGGMTALRCIRKGAIQNGQKILIYGASGAVGTYAVQLAKYYGAEVTGVCSTQNIDLVKSLGAHKVIDYTKTDFTQGNEKYDVVFDAVAKVPPAKSKKVLKTGGKYVNVHVHSDGGEQLADLLFITQLVEAGKIKPVIDRCYPFEQIVEAHRYVETGHKKGNVAIKVG